MASLSMTLDEKDLMEAITVYLSRRGLSVKGDVTINHFPGDPRDLSAA